MIAGTLEIQMMANMARLAKDMGDAKAMVEKNMKGIESAVEGAKTALAALGIGLSVNYFAGLVKNSIDAMDHLADLKEITGLTVKELSGLQLLAAQTGSSLDSLSAGIAKMSAAIGKEPERFAALGVTARDNKTAFMQLADVFSQLPDIQTRNALAQAVFNKSWQELAPALSMGGKAIGEILDKGAQLSGMTQENAEAAQRYKKEMAELNMTLGATRTQVVSNLLPAMTDITRAMKEAAKEGGTLTAVWVGMGGVAAHLFGQDDESKAAKRLAEINAQLKIARAQLESGTLNPNKAAGFWSFLIGDPKLNDEAIASIKKTVALLEAEKARLSASSANNPTGTGETEFDAHVKAFAAARAKAFIDEANAYAARVATIRGHTAAYSEAVKTMGTIGELQWKATGIDLLRTQEELMRQQQELRDRDIANQIRDQQKLKALATKKGDQKDEAAAAAAITRLEQQRVDNSKVTEEQIQTARAVTAQRQAQDRAAWEEGQVNQGAVLAQSLRDQTQQENDAYEQRKTSLQMYLSSAEGMIADDQALQQQLKMQHEGRLFMIERDKNMATRQMEMETFQMGAELLQAYAGKSKEAAIAAIVIQKGLAIANVVMNTQAAIARGYMELGPYAGTGWAAYMEGLMAVQIGIIAATGLGQISQLGKGGAAPGTPANPTSTMPQNSSTADQNQAQLASQSTTHTTIVHFDASDDDVFSGRSMRRFLKSVEEATRDGGRVIFAGGVGQP